MFILGRCNYVGMFLGVAIWLLCRGGEVCVCTPSYACSGCRVMTFVSEMFSFATVLLFLLYSDAQSYSVLTLIS